MGGDDKIVSHCTLTFLLGTVRLEAHSTYLAPPFDSRAHAVAGRMRLQPACQCREGSWVGSAAAMASARAAVMPAHHRPVEHRLLVRRELVVERHQRGLDRLDALHPGLHH